MRKQAKLSLKRYSLRLIYVFILLVIVVTGNNQKHIVVSNVNNVKSIQSSRIFTSPDIAKRIVTSTKEIKEYGKEYQVQFTGTLTGYGPDCEGCLGMVYCAPNPNVQNNKIYYNDKKYGTIRILAADYAIPCGSIIRISNYKFMGYDDFYGIVLDRGSSIVGLTMDLLYPSENDTIIIGRQYNINFTIERWGW